MVTAKEEQEPTRELEKKKKAFKPGEEPGAKEEQEPARELEENTLCKHSSSDSNSAIDTASTSPLRAVPDHLHGPG